MPRQLILAAAASAVLLAACQRVDYESQRAGLANLLRGHQIGSSADYWLVKRDLGVDDPVALVFGLYGDLAFCQDLADLYMSKYPADTYACTPAN